MSGEQNETGGQNKTLLFLIPLLVFIGMAILLYSGLGKDPTRLESQLLGKPVPSFSNSLLLNLEKQVTDKDIKGPALLNVFGSWCPTCYVEHPYLMQIAERKLVTLYGLNYNDKIAAGLEYIRKQGNPYELIIADPSGRLGIDFGVYGAPETFVIDKDNKVIYRHVGMVTPGVWEQLLKPMLYSQAEQAKESR